MKYGFEHICVVAVCELIRRHSVWCHSVRR